MIQFRREMHVRDIWEMSDKQLELMLNRVRPYMQCIHIVHTTDNIAGCIYPCHTVVVASACIHIA